MITKRLEVAIKGLLQYYYDDGDDGTSIDWTELDEHMEYLRDAYEEVI